MKILQINVWQGRLLRPLLNLIERVDPDIIFTQEIYSYPAPITIDSPWNYFGTLELIASRNHFEHVYFSPASTFPMFGRELGYGNAILSKYKPVRSSTHYTGGSGPVHHDAPTTFDGNKGRNFQHLTVIIGNLEINLINHHGHWVNQPLGDELSKARLQVVAEYIRRLPGPVIMGGDLNLLPSSPAMLAFQKSIGLRDLVATTKTHSTLSAAHYAGGIVCDYIFTSPSLATGNIEVDRKSTRLNSSH